MCRPKPLGPMSTHAHNGFPEAPFVATLGFEARARRAQRMADHEMLKLRAGRLIGRPGVCRVTQASGRGAQEPCYPGTDKTICRAQTAELAQTAETHRRDATGRATDVGQLRGRAASGHHSSIGCVLAAPLLEGMLAAGRAWARGASSTPSYYCCRRRHRMSS